MQRNAKASNNSDDYNKDVVYHDPLLHFFKLLMKIDRRVNGPPDLKESNDEGSEHN